MKYCVTISPADEPIQIEVEALSVVDAMLIALTDLEFKAGTGNVPAVRHISARPVGADKG